MKQTFEEACALVQAVMEGRWRAADDEAKAMLLEREKRAIMGYEEEIESYQADIRAILAEADVTDDFTYETAKMEAFRIPAGTAVEVYATTLHYAPCHVDDAGFQVAVILPKGTNYPLDETHADGEDALLAAKNKWLIGHAEGGLPEGSHIGLIGKNLNVRE